MTGRQPERNRGRIRSALHNLGHSFVSLMNDDEEDYIMSHLARSMRGAEPASFAFDLLGKNVSSLAPAMQESVAHYRAWFPKLLQQHGARFDDVSAAELRVDFHFDRLRPSESLPGRLVVPVICVVTMDDVQGRRHIGRVERDWLLDEEPA